MENLTLEELETEFHMPLRTIHRDFYEIMRKDIEIARETFNIAA